MKPNEQAAVLRSILKAAHKRAWHIHAAHIRVTHVHIVVRADDYVLNHQGAKLACYKDPATEPETQ